jgi:hypothetical protein
MFFPVDSVNWICSHMTLYSDYMMPLLQQLSE